MFEISNNAMDYTLAIDIGGTYTKYALLKDDSVILRKTKVLSGSVSDICNIAEKLLTEDVRRIAVSCGGFWQNGKCLGYENINGAQDLYSVLCDKFGREVWIENDAVCNLICEIKYGALKDCRDAAVLVLGTSVGCAVMLNKMIYKGAHGQAASMFLMPEITDGRNYVYDSYSNSRKAVSIAGDTRCTDFRKLCDFAKKGKDYLGILNKYVDAVALKCLYVTLAYDVERIALGGAIADNSSIISNIKRRLSSFAGTIGKDRYNPHVLPEIVKCEYGEDSNLIGASLLWSREEL